MDDKKIRELVRQEVQRTNSSSRFGLKNIPYHIHNDVDSPAIKQDNIIPSASVSGSITFASEAIYTLYINASATPRSIFCTGNVVGGTERYSFVGTAQLGPSFYFQPQDSRTVVAGGPQYPFRDPNQPEYGTNIPMQSCSYWGRENADGSGYHTLVGNFHIVDIQYPVGTSHARATIIDFSKTAVTIAVETLDSGWEINANFVVT